MTKNARNFRDAALQPTLRDEGDVARYVYSLQATGALSVVDHLILLQDVAIKQGKDMEPKALQYLERQIDALWCQLPEG